MNWNESNIPSQQGRLAVITGTGGLGFEAARALAQANASVVLAGRNVQKGTEAVNRIRQLAPQAEVRFEALDLASLDSVRAFAERLNAAGQPIDILLNNAGIMGLPKRQLTRDGFEMQFGTNYLGHFALTMRLLPLLRRANSARVVSVSSGTHAIGRLNFDDLQSQKSYRPDGAYANSKLAVLLFAQELDRRLKAVGLPILSVAAHPGAARTHLMTNGPRGRLATQLFSYLFGLFFAQSAADGALPLLRAATDPGVRGREYYGPSGLGGMRGSPAPSAMSPKARDEGAARRLWDVSEELTGLSFVQSLQ